MPNTPLDPLPRAVLFDRDGTLVVDTPYNGDPARVRPMAGSAVALSRIRTSGIPVGLISNQSGVGRGLITTGQLQAVTERVNALLGPFAVILNCPHRPEDGCLCRKPAPGMVIEACQQLGVSPQETLVVGDIGSDMAAAQAAGAQGVLVPNRVTRYEEVLAAPRVARSLLEVAELVCNPRVAHRDAREEPTRDRPAAARTAKVRP
ncbi:haloacid dehalogenase superfamily, subfamily IA, variant 3 with third motif having DD or ED/haloacid dehalogenase superfamily, subfamily IA, variant 1 with third motif having Dx(3-4)D or Dx(3-4)E [Propionibacterium cyclohexanicum]|uniref:D,D-heptose 1,7-bisphosphate phosphatase n=1 Tax=Propionibacterium cyclohexanicum TaxID=64702 RepID=A0A1H9SGR0_9ACTN|nr:HAD family hydrolase [Propionibacterium cyclohexanicum]SER84226.1 haloacid dehalogenase superfamily, subfamily IA, variant 3 with third motif having DD or ED/haloacid dehalogenase superfamily, subfamily IA, variant 1 with third motif having Dx(3-4)D or Dx(3-4)E [Propionibacterium cyclohexanicum]